jgi:hypothetical protein
VVASLDYFGGKFADADGSEVWHTLATVRGNVTVDDAGDVVFAGTDLDEEQLSVVKVHGVDETDL